jgi:hypothetical protein
MKKRPDFGLRTQVYHKINFVKKSRRFASPAFFVAGNGFFTDACAEREACNP